MDSSVGTRAGALVDVVTTEAEAAGLAVPPLLVRAAVEGFLDERGLGSGPLRETLVGGGHSNVTFLLDRDDWRGVLRRSPRPPYQPKAHDMGREAVVQQALADSDVPVPRIDAVETTGAVLGVPFYVMDWLDGDVVTDAVPPLLASPAGHRGLGEAFVDTLALLHAQDYAQLGLGGLGRPDGMAERQLSVFSRLWESHRTRDIPAVDAAERWLREHLPPPSGPAALVHGDFRLGNLMWARTDQARVRALLDWELATIGEPLSDLGYLLSTYPERPEERGALLSLATAVVAPGFPSRADLIGRYAEATGRDLTGLRWWLVLAFWRTAVGLESFYRRGLAGTTDDPFILELESGVPELADQALLAIEGGWA
ncbi:MAG: phosphotransferase family protein [Nocardioides sp.]|uniref:phosphotransferase family protein n=1 Tax=Nocardioides sp. TaxID=35761 RepID=UPI0039E60FC6